MKYTVQFDDVVSTVYGYEPTEYISSYLAKGTFYEKPLLSYIRDNYKGALSIVDVGANIGNHAVFFHDVMGVKDITCFEPNPENYRRLQKSAPFAQTFALALAESGHPVESISSPHNMGASYCISNISGNVQAERLDEFDLSPDIIKIDAEGMECAVLKGATDTIKKHRPVMFVEHNDLQHLYKFNRVLQDIGVEYRIKPFVTETWEVFEYIPV